MPHAETRPVFRFAPSPNGLLHLGHARSALLNQRAAIQADGRLLLRIEDIDATRCTPEFEAAIYEDLRWLGLSWERPVRRQSEHFVAYAAALEALRAKGLVYESFETRGDVRRAIEGRPDWPRDPDGAPVFPFARDNISEAERARRRASGEPYALRLDMAAAIEATGGAPGWREFSKPSEHPGDPHAWGDVIVARKEVPTSYHLSVVVDDAVQGVTHVVRGQDLRAATSVHRVLQVLLGLPAPVYHHHTLLLDADGRKLSKSLGSESLRAIRANGATPEDVRRLALADAEDQEPDRYGEQAQPG